MDILGFNIEDVAPFQIPGGRFRSMEFRPVVNAEFVKELGMGVRGAVTRRARLLGEVGGLVYNFNIKLKYNYMS